MMFRSVQAEDESGSDWDDITPNTTPRQELQPPANLYTPTAAPTTIHSPHHQSQSSSKSVNVPAHEMQVHVKQPHTLHEPHPPQVPHTSHHSIHEPHNPQGSHSPYQPQTLLLPQASHSSQHTTVHVEAHDKTPSRHHTRHKSHKTHNPTRHTATHRPSYSPQDTSQFTYEALPKHPRTLPPIEQAISSIPTTSPPLTPAVINPVYGGPSLTSNSTVQTHHDETLIQAVGSSEILEFASVNGEAARKLLPTHGRPQTYSYMGDVAERSEKLSKRCTEEVVSCMKIVSDFIINFILGLFHYILFHIGRKLFCGAVRILSDTCVKSAIDVIFNELLWPVCACLYQLSKALVLVLTPMVDLLGVLLNYVANVCRACRLIDLHLGGNAITRPITV